ncbi:hypothetical protein AURDEDRAFT_160472 [Auricularia subglabra TFB-10046 SS5]|nr:hypothetical protein AURDEDRAFT_160472 [Auricularia subglabra TFB-10046 SS5]
MSSMRFLLSAVLLAVGAGAVNIVIYPNSDNCNDNTGGLQCGNIVADVCCENGGGDIFSARCMGLDTTGVPDTCTIGVGSNANWCATNCNAGSGQATICLNPGTCPAGTGSFWISRSAAVEGAEVPAKCESSQKPDSAFFAGGQRRFRINYDVPANITALLVDLVKTDPSLSKGVPEVALPFEIKDNDA